MINKIQPLANRDNLANFWNQSLSAHLGPRLAVFLKKILNAAASDPHRYPKQSYSSSRKSRRLLAQGEKADYTMGSKELQLLTKISH